MTTPQFPVEVTGLTFDELYSQFRTLAQRVLPNWNVDEVNDPVVFFAEVYLQALDRGIKFANWMANEFSLSSAVDRRSVVAHADRLNYTVSTGQPSLINVQLTYTTDPSPRTIEAYAIRISTTPASEEEQPIYFENVAQVVLPANSTQHVVQFVEGRQVTESFLGSGKPFQRFRLSQRPVMIEEILVESNRVQVDGTTWVRTDGLAQEEQLDEVYELSVDGTGLGEITFGDGFKGKIPNDEAVIAVRYRVGGGVRGNILVGQANLIVAAPSYITAVINIAQGSGGTAKESIDHIKIYAPLSITEGGQLNTLPVIRAFLESQSSVARAKVFLDTLNRIKALILTAQGFTLEQIENQIQLAVLDRLIMGFNIEIEFPLFREVDVSVKVWVVDDAQKSAVEASVRTQIDTWLNPLAQDANGSFINDFGQDLRLSDLGFLLKEVPEVFDYEILEPTGNVEVDDNQIVTNRHIQTTVDVEVVGGQVQSAGATPPVFKVDLYPDLS
jgi:hypothetical protein